MRDKIRKRVRAKKFQKNLKVVKDKELIQFWDQFANEVRNERRQKPTK